MQSDAILLNFSDIVSFLQQDTPHFIDEMAEDIGKDFHSPTDKHPGNLCRVIEKHIYFGRVFRIQGHIPR